MRLRELKEAEDRLLDWVINELPIFIIVPVLILSVGLVVVTMILMVFLIIKIITWGLSGGGL